MRISRLTLILFLLFVTTRGSGESTQTTQKKEWLSYQPAVVELRGTLHVKTFYGPPNYGENPATDAREESPILILRNPVNVRGNRNPQIEFDRKSVRNLRAMHLVLVMPHKEFIGKKVIVKGTLFHAFTGHHHTAVLMNVQSIKLDPKVIMHE